MQTCTQIQCVCVLKRFFFAAKLTQLGAVSVAKTTLYPLAWGGASLCTLYTYPVHAQNTSNFATVLVQLGVKLPCFDSSQTVLPTTQQLKARASEADYPHKMALLVIL